MLFHTFEFWCLFLPVVALAFAAGAGGRFRAAVGVLVVGSLAFYAWSRPWHLAVLLASIVFNYWVAGAVLRRRGTRAGRAWLAAGIAANLAVLAWFKYAAFLAGNLAAAGGWAFSVAQVALPLGISFFTFQKIAYLVGAWRGDFDRQSLPDYALFVTFFPQLIAGPITHHREFFPQLHAPGFVRWDGARIAAGLGVYLLGVAKKRLLADALAPEADAVFAQFAAGAPVAALDAWRGVLSYGFQLYFDFSGYTDMALGLAWIVGIRLPENFLAPYRACSLADFWRRWHATLGRFLRDYVYIPLGGNRGGAARTARNLMVTMLLGGFWHGAAWTFVVWGAVHGAGLLVERGWRATGWRLPRPAAWLLTFTFVMLAWVWFRAADFPAAVRAFGALAGQQGGWWPGGHGSLEAWLAALRPDRANEPVLTALYSWGVGGHLAGRPWNWLYAVLSPAAAQWALLGAAALVVAVGRPTWRWLADETGTAPRLRPGAAVLAGAVAVLLFLGGGTSLASEFIYFRF